MNNKAIIASLLTILMGTIGQAADVSASPPLRGQGNPARGILRPYRPTTNHLGNIAVSYPRDESGENLKIADLEIRAGQVKPARLRVTNCLEFIDAFYDEKSGDVAVIFVEGLCLRYERYSRPEAWQLVQRVDLVEYSTRFASLSSNNGVKLTDVGTVRAAFIKNGESFQRNGRRFGAEEPGDPIYVIRVSPSGEVTINGKPRASMTLDSRPRPPE